MHSESRRNFVKKSLATSVTISFAGLIRAHGQEGGGTTWNAGQTTYSSTTGSGATTWNPGQNTTYSSTWNPGQNTTYDTTYQSTTWNPEETTVLTTAPKTCEWIIEIDVVFDGRKDTPDQDRQVDLVQRSGWIYTGIMRCKITDCSGAIRYTNYPVETGGYDVSSYLYRDSEMPIPPGEKDAPKGSDTGTPPGSYTVERTKKNWGKIPQGHTMSDPPGRNAILVHDPIRKPGTSGCIAITTDFAKWSKFMGQRPCDLFDRCNTSPNPDKVPMKVYYKINVTPDYKWVPDPEDSGDPPLPNPYPPTYANPSGGIPSL